MSNATEIIRMTKEIYEKLRLSESSTTPSQKLLFAAAHELEQLLAENKQLKEFARYVIRQECWSIYADGDDIQKWALKLGLIESYIVTAEQADDEFAPGDTKYRFTKTLEGE